MSVQEERLGPGHEVSLVRSTEELLVSVETSENAWDEAALELLERRVDWAIIRARLELRFADGWLPPNVELDITEGRPPVDILREFGRGKVRSQVALSAMMVVEHSPGILFEYLDELEEPEKQLSLWWDKLLKKPNSFFAQAVIGILSKLGRRADCLLERVAHHLGSSDQEIRRAAALVVREGAQVAPAEMVRKLWDSYLTYGLDHFPNSHLEALEAWSQSKRSCRETLLAWISDSQTATESHLPVAALERLCGLEHRNLALKLSSSAEPMVRFYAARILGKLHRADDVTWERLYELSFDPDYRVRCAAILGLGRTGLKKERVALRATDLMDDDEGHDRLPSDAAVECLALLEEHALPALDKLLSRLADEDLDSLDKLAVVDALGAIGPKALPARDKLWELLLYGYKCEPILEAIRAIER